VKFVLSRLKIGDLVSAQVVEHIAGQDLIVNFQGDLIRVSNKTPDHFVLGQNIKLKVIRLRPLGFQLLSNKNRNGLSVSV
jgi:hypothetical protein